MARSLSKNEEIAYLGLMLTATRLNDLGRIMAIIQRLKQIIFPENPDVEINEVQILGVSNHIIDVDKKVKINDLK